MRRAFTTKPARSGEGMTFLPSESGAYCAVRAVVSGLVSNDEINSTSRRTGTGLKKCIPMTCSGRCVAMANFMMGMEEGVGGENGRGIHDRGVDLSKDVQLDLFVLGDRLNDQFAVGQAEKSVEYV